MYGLLIIIQAGRLPFMRFWLLFHTSSLMTSLCSSSDAVSASTADAVLYWRQWQRNGDDDDDM